MLALKLREPPSNLEIERLAEQNPGYRFEREPDGTLIVSPTGSAAGARNARLTALLSRWNDGLNEPGICFDSSTGFTLPDGSLISPDGSWVEAARWRALSDDQRESYAPLVPDVVVEIASKTDRVDALRAKLARCRALGAQYVLLLDPYKHERWSDGSPPAGLNVGLADIE